MQKKSFFIIGNIKNYRKCPALQVRIRRIIVARAQDGIDFVQQILICCWDRSFKILISFIVHYIYMLSIICKNAGMIIIRLIVN